MRKVLFKSLNQKSTVTYSEAGIVSCEDQFVPLTSLKLNLYIKDGMPYLWALYSPSFSFAYLTHQLDDFIRIVESTIRQKAEYAIQEIMSISKGEVLYLEDGLKFEYSYRRSLLLEYNNPEKKISNSLWIEDWAIQQMFTFDREFDGGFSEKEQNILANSENDFNYGEFHQEEKSSTSPWGCILIIIAVLVGWYLGMISH